MIQIVWEFLARADAVADFENAYGPRGEWARLFERFPGYGGTVLLRDTADRRRFLTIDRWESRRDFLEMHAGAAEEYARLDARVSALTESEHDVGVFEAL